MEVNQFTADKYKSISGAYDGRSIFVTGSTGFLGKVFVEKVLYRCPKIAKVYVLIRDTEKVSAKEKFKKMLDSPPFKRLREERPQDLEKIILVVGDLSKPNLGIEIEDEQLLIENVSMVFHFAATVKFNEPLQVAINFNVEGTRRILDLCLRMKKLQVFLYVSTVYSNSNRQVIDEVVYPSPIPLSAIDEIMKQNTISEKETKMILGAYPNTYTLTKALAENLVAKFHEQHNIATVIVRPSIVVSCKDEPMSGWIDNWFGATSIVVTLGKGLIRTLLGAGSNTIDLIPADYVANVIAVAAARCEGSKNVEVYNSCTSHANPITLGKLNKLIVEYSKKHRLNDLPLPGLFFVKSRWLMISIIFLLEILPAYVADLYLRIIGKKSKYMKFQSKITGLRILLEPFTSRTWMVRSQNTSNLSASLSSNDRRVFECDPTSFKWEEFLPVYFSGIWKYLIESKL